MYKLWVPQILDLPLVQKLTAGTEIIWQKQGSMKKKRFERESNRKSRNKNIESVKKNLVEELNRKLDRTTERLSEI